MSKKDVARSKPTKGKDTAKKESGAQPDLNAIREAVVAANVAKPAPFPDLVEEAHSLLRKIADQIDVPVKTEEGHAEFASLAERFNFIDREVEVGHEAIAVAKQREVAFEHLIETALNLRDQYGSRETTKLVTSLLGRLVADAYVDGPTCGGVFKVPTFPSEAHPLDDEPSGGWPDGMPG